jgi:hypothetical protein
VDPLPPLIPGLIQNLSLSIPGLIKKMCSAGPKQIHSQDSASALLSLLSPNKFAISHENRKQNLMSSQLQDYKALEIYNRITYIYQKKIQISMQSKPNRISMAADSMYTYPGI